MDSPSAQDVFDGECSPGFTSGVRRLASSKYGELKDSKYSELTGGEYSGPTGSKYGERLSIVLEKKVKGRKDAESRGRKLLPQF